MFEDEEENIHQPVRLHLSLVAGALLAAVAGAQLFVLPEQSPRVFALPISVPMTAAFLGACYLASCAMFILAARQRLWANVRALAPGAAVLTSLTLTATLLALPAFSFGAPGMLARSAAWAWLLIHVIATPGWLLFLAVNETAPGTDPVSRQRLPLLLVVVLVLQAALLLFAGSALYALPTGLPIWPWALSGLTARLVGAWLVAIGVTGLAAAIEPDRRRLGPPLLAYGLLGALQLLVFARYSATLTLGDRRVEAYLALLLSILAVGLFGARLAIRDDRRRAAPLVR